MAPGPSLTDEDLALVRTVPVLVINDAILSVPQADVLYAADWQWWSWHAALTRSLTCWKYSLHVSAPRYDPDVSVLTRRPDPGLSTDPRVLHIGGHGGYQAINLAVHLVGPGGTILLLGYDMQPTIEHGTIRHHAIREHPDGRHIRDYTRWLPAYAAAYDACRLRSIRLLNATRRTAITAVPRVDLAAALAGDLPA